MDMIKPALLSFPEFSTEVEKDGTDWVIDLGNLPPGLCGGTILRRIDEFYLRAQLERRFEYERKAIVKLAFGEDVDTNGGSSL